MANIASTRMTIGSVLGAVQTAAITVSGTLDAAGSAIGMLNATVSKAAKEQSIRHAIDVNEFKSRLVQEVAMQRSQRERQVLEFCQDEQNAKLYKSAHDELTELVKSL